MGDFCYMLDKYKNNKNNILLLLITSVVIVFCFALWYLSVEDHLNGDDNQTIYSQTGSFDLTEFDFSKGIITTSGAEEFIEGALLTPSEFDMLSEEIKIGSTGNFPVNTSRITLYLPQNESYTIMGNSFDFAERIYINGELVGEVGVVSTTAHTSTPDHAYLNFTVTPENGIIEIVRQSNNFVHRDNGTAAHFIIGTADTMSRLRSIEYGTVGIMIGLFVTIAISHIFLFMLFERHKAHLFFAILSLTWGIRLGVTGIKVFGEWFPALSWEVLFRVEYMTVPITSSMMLLVANEIFLKTLPKLFLRIFVGGFLIYSVFCLFVPTLPLSYSMIYLQVAFILGSILLLVFITLKLIDMIKNREVRINHLLFIIGYLPFIVSVVHDALYYNSILIFGIRVLLIDLSLMIIVVTQTAVIYFDTAQKMVSIYKAEQENRIEAASLRQAKKMHENFLRTLSHEMQLPLTTVSGYAQLTSQILSEDETINRASIAEKMRIIDDEARKLSRQVSWLLDVSAIDNGTFKLYLQKVDVNELFSKIITHHFPIMNSGDIALNIETEDKLPYIFADKERTLQVILNIISNSIKHSGCTKIILSATVCEKDNKFLSVSVLDNGKGIPDELKEELFSRYPKHRSEKGNGLGLYIVAQTVAAEGGQISYESDENIGTKIIFTLPIWEEV